MGLRVNSGLEREITICPGILQSGRPLDLDKWNRKGNGIERLAGSQRVMELQDSVPSCSAVCICESFRGRDGARGDTR